MNRLFQQLWTRAWPSLQLGLDLAALLGLYLLQDRILRTVGQLPESSYRQPVILLEVGSRLFYSAWFEEFSSDLLEDRGPLLLLFWAVLLVIHILSTLRSGKTRKPFGALGLESPTARLCDD